MILESVFSLILAFLVKPLVHLIFYKITTEEQRKTIRIVLYVILVISWVGFFVAKSSIAKKTSNVEKAMEGVLEGAK